MNKIMCSYLSYLDYILDCVDANCCLGMETFLRINTRTYFPIDILNRWEKYHDISLRDGVKGYFKMIENICEPMYTKDEDWEGEYYVDDIMENDESDESYELARRYLSR